MSIISLKVNRRVHAVDTDPATPLLYVLADELHLRGPKFGCGLGQCGACTVIVDGHTLRSCITPVSAVNHAEIVTLEGLGTPENPHSASFYRRASGSVRFLSEWRNSHREGVPRPESKGD